MSTWLDLKLMLNQTRSHALRLSLVLLLTLLTACAVSAMMWRGFKSRTTATAVRKDSQPQQGKIGYIGEHTVWPSMRDPFRVMASRLEKPGAEMIVFTGSLSRPKSQNPDPVLVRLILEHPNRLRLEEGNKVMIFDGSSLTKIGGALTDDDADEAETLLLDFPERLFVGHVTGNPMSQLGSRFRKDDGSDPNYRGQYYDVFKVAEGLSISVNPPGAGARGSRPNAISSIPTRICLSGSFMSDAGAIAPQV